MTVSPMTLVVGVVLVAFVAALLAAQRYLKPFFRRIVVVLVPLAIGGLLVANALYQGSFKLGVDLVGGTILIYEIDLDKFPDGKLPDTYKPEELVNSLKRRLDPADLKTLTIRPVSNTRVEIILPTGGKKQDSVEGRKQLTPEDVQNTKELISRVGSLEFRILANERDDKEALEAARRYFEEVKKKPELRKDLEERALKGQPPPGPKPVKGKEFLVTLGGETTPTSYSWVELGKSERNTLGLNNDAEKDPKKSFLWRRAADARGKLEPISLDGMEALLFSREVMNKERLLEQDRDKNYEYFVLTRDPEKGKEVTGKYLVRADLTQDERGGLAIGFHFNSQGGALFGELSGKNFSKKESDGDFRRSLAIVLDGQIESAPRLNARITTDGIITGNFTKEDVDRTVQILRAGQLPATLKPQPVSENTMGATLGADTIRKGTASVGVAFLFVLVFMIVYYRFAGLVASLALLANLLLTVGAMVLLNATFTLPGLAGLVLMLGMAVDANVLIYERLREERDRGASLALAIRNGYDRAFPTIIDTHLSSIFTAIVLYTVGNDQLKGFGVSLTLGLIISLFTSLYMTRLLFDIWQAQGWLHKLSMMRLFSRPSIDFMSIRYYWFTATLLLTVLGISVFIGRLPNDLNIDFNGGTAYGGQLVRPVTIGALRDLLDETAQKENLAVVKVRELPDSDGLAFEITYRNPDGTEVPRTIQLPNRPGDKEKDSGAGQSAAASALTLEQREAIVRHRASQLPDLSVEQIFPGFATGNESARFTVRTSEKAPELVQAAVGRLLGDQLKRIELSYEITQKGKTAALVFKDPIDKEELFASPGQVRMLLERIFKKQGIDGQWTLVPEGKNEEGRYQKMQLVMNDPLNPPEKFEEALKAVQREFAERPQPDRLENFDSQLASETQTRAMYAILASWVAILIYLWFRFGSWTFGLAAVFCLIHDLFFTLGIIAFCHYISHTWLAGPLLIQDFKIDLPAVAALLTLVGYSVNDTIVVFDRIREVRGKNPDLTPQMINDSVNQTLSRTLLASLTTWLVVFVLYVAGGEGVHLFAFCMVVGVIVGTYSSIYIASPLLLIFGEGARRSAQQERKTQPAEAPA